jgi:hypothetical protein
MKIDRVLIYLAGSNLNSLEKEFVDGLKEPYTCRNSQFFKAVEDFKTVYNLAGNEEVAKAYPNSTNPLAIVEPKPDDGEVKLNKGGRPPKLK